jgi:outer membrane lipopolysaccharide assembly protein LptE/RlpB
MRPRFRWETLSAACALLALLLGASCGYRFQSAGKIPEGLEPIFIDVFENRTSESGLEATVTNAVVIEFTRRNRSALAANAAAASVVMKGVIRSVDLQAISTRGRDVTGERRVSLNVDVQLVTPGGKVAWSVKNLTDNEGFPVSNDKFANDERQRAALFLVASRIAERIYSRLTDEF